MFGEAVGKLCKNLLKLYKNWTHQTLGDDRIRVRNGYQGLGNLNIIDTNGFVNGTNGYVLLCKRSC